MVTLNAELYVTDEAEVGESPLFDPDTGSFYWVDLTQGVLNELTADGTRNRSVVAPLIGAIGLTAEPNRFAAIGEDGFGIVADGQYTSRAPIDPQPGVFRMNDGKVDPRGRMWGGRTHYEFLGGVGSLHVWDGGDMQRTVTTGLGLPNGIGWSPDQRTMYFVDTTAHTLFRATFDADDGEIGELQPLAIVTSGNPDGLAVDSDGCIWLAVWGGGHVLRISPEGAVIATVRLPVSRPASCAFGAGTELLITTARMGVDTEAEPLAGSVFAVDVGIEAVPVARFRGSA